MVTMKQIAAAAGVSRSTVSFILNDSYKPGVNIPISTRQRVKAVAEKMGYLRNEMAVAMITGQTKVIGFCAPDLRNEYIPRTLEGIFKGAQNRNYYIKLFDTSDTVNNTLSSIIGQRPSGIITWSPQKDFLASLKKHYMKYKIPVIQIGSCIPCKWTGIVTSNDAEGSKFAVEKLLQLGHRNILHVSQGLEFPFAADRWKGFQQAIKSAKLNCGRSHLLEVKDELELTEKIKAKFHSTHKSTAITCASDMLAMQVLRVLNSLEFSVPDDISVIGFADLAMAQYATPSLTTIAQPFEEIGLTAANMLLDMIENKYEGNPHKILDVKFINRNSISQVQIKGHENAQYRL